MSQQIPKIALTVITIKVTRFRTLSNPGNPKLKSSYQQVILSIFNSAYGFHYSRPLLFKDHNLLAVDPNYG